MMFLNDLVTVDKAVDTAIYLQIANAIIQAIRRGRLRSGSKLPGSRELATALGVHRKTTVAAYEELLAQGWLEMIPRKGTFVVQDLPEIKPKKLKQTETSVAYPEKTIFSIDEKRFVQFPALGFPDTKKLIINDGFPDMRLIPNELFLRELRSMGKQPAFKKYNMYGRAEGTDYLRDTLSSFLRETRGLPISAANVMITRGAQMGIYMAASLLLKPGDQVIVGEPSYFAATLTFQQTGASINRVPVDEGGLAIDAVERLCLTKKIRLLYVIPHHHHPTTVTLTPERRIRLLELAATYKFAIIEDDYDYDFHYTSNPILPMASLDHHGSVIYIGTLSKTLVPAIRIGFIVAPENFIKAVANLRMGIDRQGDSMMEVAIAELYRNGTIGRHIRKVVNLYRERRDHFCSLLTENLGQRVTFRIPDGGMSVWTRFNDSDLRNVSAKAFQKGLIMSDGQRYNTGTINYNSARLGFASLNLAEQERAIDIIARCL
ncbi:MocR-like pyridoxine biosynthesis transcription factor PdxR [Spirosoma endbachense]|uniref:Aminotransferase class I/II-fold pyridoxal phosphate-dependent enzyme n=1 Tax=Spirosoma endbachense TaxID=2666025 RepID=A0A6P1VLV5_9BACT|nr:PLP-dependent aminotransferase family protein [Spirosoma endbachense]QHV93665.1 aminotransferase class I/II-fold pyridoxal phosphate-dependent enzyme [Spirosoma endbachense]